MIYRVVSRSPEERTKITPAIKAKEEMKKNHQFIHSPISKFARMERRETWRKYAGGLGIELNRTSEMSDGKRCEWSADSFSKQKWRTLLSDPICGKKRHFKLNVSRYSVWEVS